VLLPEPEAIPDAPDWAKPNRSWVQQFVSDFQQLRQQVQQAYEQQGRHKKLVVTCGFAEAITAVLLWYNS